MLPNILCQIKRRQYWFTDPPYYDAIPYADLSDFFLVWLKRTLPGHPLLRDPFDPTNPLSPKMREAVQDETKKCQRPAEGPCFLRANDGESIRRRAPSAARGRHRQRRVRSQDHRRLGSLLSGMIRGGWTITGSWPISTEMATRLRARDSAALATSVHLVCRPRPEDARSATGARYSANCRTASPTG